MSDHNIASPLPGIFYRRPSPEEPPFVEEGGEVAVGQTIGLVEIMKQFTEVKSEVAGILTSFAVEDQGMVNPGDTLAVVRGGDS